MEIDHLLLNTNYTVISEYFMMKYVTCINDKATKIELHEGTDI